MPPRRETNPAILEQRKLRKIEKARFPTRAYREKAKTLATEMLGQAFANVCDGPNIPTTDGQTLAVRTAQGILKSSLRRHGVTIERIVDTVSHAIDAVKFREVGDEVTQIPSWQERLRACDTGLRLMERSGDLPEESGPGPSSIVVNVLVLPER